MTVTATALTACATTGETRPAPAAQAGPAIPAVRLEGLFAVRPDSAGARVLIELPPAGADGVMLRVIHHTSLRTGVGSATTGLDRAQIGPTHILAFRRLGDRVVAEYENPAYRAARGSAAEQAAARDAFLGSTVWAGKIEQATPDGGAIVDISGFLTWDAAGIADTLKRAGQGTFRPVPDLTLIDQLLQQPQRFEFFQAVRLLVGWLAEHGVAPEQATLSALSITAAAPARRGSRAPRRPGPSMLRASWS